jgi:spore coat protein U-like protein
MKTKLLATAAALALGMTSAVQAADTNTLTVTADINGACGFQLPTSTLAFGVLDPTSVADATASVDIDYWCTVGTTAATVAGDGDHFSGSRRMNDGGTNYIPYDLGLAGHTGTGLGKSTPLTMTVTGTIANGDYVNAAVGAYADTVVLTLTP